MSGAELGSAKLKIASLGSGSGGNSVLVRSRETTVLLDCGFTLKETTARMRTLGVDPGQLDAVLITHEHSDHTRGLGPLARKYNVPVMMTHGTWRAIKDKNIAQVQQFHAHEAFSIGDITLDPFPTPHDAAESCQFVFSAEGRRFACVTDLGACTEHVASKVSGVHAILVESNYDPDMLRNGPYPQYLQARIASDWGHLANEQAGELLAALDHADLQRIWLGHLSEKNNTDKLALATVCKYVAERQERLHVLQQHCASEWFALE